MNSSPLGRRRLAILTNILAPYRLPIFERLAEHMDVTVLYSGEEGNRARWTGLDNEVRKTRVKRVPGFTLTWSKQDGGAAFDTKYLHVNPALFTDLLRIRPDAIVTDEMGFRTAVALLYAKVFAKPVWVWWGGTLHTERELSMARRVFRRWLVRRVRRWFSYGATSTQYLTSLGVSPRDVVEVQNCVPEQLYLDAQPPTVHLACKPVLLCVGQLMPRKGVDLLLQAAAEVQADGLTFSLLIVGDGPEKPLLEARAEVLGLRNLHFHTGEPPRRMPGIYRSGDVLVFPTREDVWGLVVNEALWSGLPVLVSRYAGCASDIVPSSNIFDPLDRYEFVSKLRLAIAGRLQPHDPARLKSLDEVSQVILRELNSALSDSS
jgi:glycosyltransferase involved in cell wall biosynthesis